MSDPHIPFSRPAAGTEYDYSELAKAFDKRYAPRINVPVIVNNGSNKLIGWMLGIVAALVTAGVVGEILVYGQVQAIEVDLKSLHTLVDLIVQGKIK